MGRKLTTAPMPTPERLLKVEEVMARLGYGRNKVYALITSGRLPSVKDGKYRRVRESTLVAFMERGEGAA